jgi:hypothetical protein
MGAHQGQIELTRVASFVVFSVALLTFLTALLLALLWFLRGPLALRSFVPGLATLVPAAHAGHPLLRLLPLMLGGQASPC